MAARKSANAAGVRKVKAVFVKHLYSGGNTFKYIRQPFNIIEYDWGNGETADYIELCLGNRFRSHRNEDSECYDDVLFLTASELTKYPSIDANDDVPNR